MSSRLVVLVLTGLLVLGLFIQGCGTKEEETSAPADTRDTATVAESPGRDSLTFEVIGRDSVTAFELLQQSHYVEFRSTAMGVFVTAIDSVRAGGDANWIYTVNDTTPKIASDKMFTRTGDRVVWHLRLQSQ